MAQWLSKIVHALAGQTEHRDVVRAVLVSAQRARVKIALSTVESGHAAVMTTTIEQVRDEDLVICQPSIGGLVHPLAFGEGLTISFVNQSLYHSGATRCLGRVKISTGGIVHATGEHDGATIFAYRLALPESLGVEDRRRQPRHNMAFAKPPEAQLYASDTGDGPIFGLIAELAMDGARITTTLPPGRIQAGGQIYLKASLPEPVGLIDELVDIARVTENSRRGAHEIAVQFRRKIEGLDMLMRTAAAASDQLRRRAG